jgi:hypothetical protein
MARHRFFAITLMGIGMLLNSRAEAVTDAPRCENNAANCIGRCVNPGGGTNDNKCMIKCDGQGTKCLIRALSRTCRRLANLLRRCAGRHHRTPYRLPERRRSMGVGLSGAIGWVGQHGGLGGSYGRRPDETIFPN